ncbi:MAG: hypothetical protein MUF64_33190, partial [Polyangiaceae bacterium]|nr:hypothetical protein [Polyangiaceae bacterium]
PILDDGDACTIQSCDPNQGPSVDPVICPEPTCDVALGVISSYPSCDPTMGCKLEEKKCPNGFTCTGDDKNTIECISACNKGDPTSCQDGLVCNSAEDGCGKPNGEPCGVASECANGFCEQSASGKICAEKSCNGCEFVNSSGNGCDPIPDGVDPKNFCNEQENGCKSTKNCNGNRQCGKLPQGAKCGALELLFVCKNDECRL